MNSKYWLLWLFWKKCAVPSIFEPQRFVSKALVFHLQFMTQSGGRERTVCHNLRAFGSDAPALAFVRLSGETVLVEATNQHTRNRT